MLATLVKQVFHTEKKSSKPRLNGSIKEKRNKL